MKKGIFTSIFCIVIGYVFGQSEGDYRSRSNGNWSQATRWQVFFNGAWRNLNTGAAGPYQNVLPTSASGAINIQAGTSINISVSTNANQLTVESGATLRINANRSLTIVDDFAETPLIVNGTLNNNGGTLDLQSQLTATPCQVNGTLRSVGIVSVANSSLLLFNSGSVYRHAHRTSGTVPSSTWNNGSTCLITGMTNRNATTPLNLGQSFWHFTWNTPSMGNIPSFSLAGGLQTVNGNLTFVSTGGTPRVVRLDNGGPGYNLTIGGNFVIQGGLVTLTQAQTSATAVTIGGNLDISGGTLTLGTSNNSAIDILLNGNFQKTGGIISHGGSGAGTIRFDGGNQTYTNNAAITSAVNFSVESGSNLNLGTAFLTGTGTFDLNGGGILQVGSIDAGGAIQLGTAGGNIRVSGTRTYNSNSEVIYNGVGGQFMASGHPAAPNTTIFNSANVVLLSDVTIGSLLVDEGAFVAGNRIINITRLLVVDDELQAGQSTFNFNGGTPQAISATFPLTLFNIAVNQSPASTLTVTSALNIENEIAVNSASTVAAGTNLLRLLSTPTRTANVAPILNGGSITGSVIVQRHLPKAVAANSFFYMGSPVTNSTLADWDVELPLGRAYRWNEPTRAYVQYTGALPSGLGLAVRVNSTATFTTDVRGTLRQGPISVNVTSQSPIVDSPDGWNLVGNPYPSAIDWDNITKPAGIYNSMYITDNFNNSGQGTGIQRVTYVDGVGTPGTYGGEIAQGQAFWIKATANSTLNFTESAKIPATDTQYYRQGEIPNVLRIVMEGQGLKDETVLRLREGATLKFDGMYDAEKFFADEFKLTTVTSDNIKTAINAIGTTDCSTPVPLSIEGAAIGQYQFNFNGLESFEGNIGIVLEDILEKKTINIGTEKIYAFSITEDNINTLGSRFRITISSPTANTLVTTVGESVCDDKATALITIKDSEKGVEYSATWNGEKLSASEVGTGSNIQLTINANSLEVGENKITVWATSSGSCSSQAALIESPVVSKIKTHEIGLVSEGLICNEGTTSLTATGVVDSGFYNWYEDLDSNEPIISEQEGLFVTPALTKTKTYYVAAVNSLGCESARVPVKAVVSYVENVSLTMLDDTTLKSSQQTGNTWYLNDNLISEEISDVLIATEPGIYTLKVNQGGCIVSASREISELAFEGGTNVEPSITIYPNPAQNKVYVQVRSRNELVRAIIVNSTGVEMASENLIGGNEIKEGEFDLVSFAPGIYNIRIVDGSKLSVRKIAKVN